MTRLQKLIPIILLFACLSFARERIDGRAYPGARITVYITGSGGTLATLYSDNLGTPLSNPFTADPTTGYWLFYPDNGTYDVQETFGSTTYTHGAVTAFDIGIYRPTTVTAFATSTSSGTFAIDTPAGGVLAITANPTVSTITFWQWPSSDSPGCMQSSGPPGHVLSFGVCPAAGADTQVQFNRTGSLAGDPALLWLYSTHQLVTGSNGLSNAITSSTDGITMRSGTFIQNASNTKGGYVHLTPVTYNPYDSPTQCLDQFGNIVTQPLPLGGDAFNAMDAVLWVSTSPLMPPNGSCGAPIGNNVLYGLNLNSYFLAMGGLATTNNAYNSIDSLLGGLHVKLGAAIEQAAYLLNHPTSADLNTPAAGYGALSHQSGSTYWYWNDVTSTWATVNFASGGGGGGTPGGSDTQVQYNGPQGIGGSFAGSSNLTWNNSGQLLNIIAASASSAGLNVQNGFIQSAVGFVTAGTTYNAINAVSGGVASTSLTSSAYVQTGNSTGVPALTSGDSFHAGALYWDNGGACEKVFNGSTWMCLGSGGGSPGGGTAAVQYNNAGAFAGSPNFTWNNASQLLNIVASSASAAGINVQTGFIQSAVGFVGVPASATTYNAFAAVGGGMTGKSFTATNYVQTGNSNGVPALTTGDSYHAGAQYYDTGANCQEVYNGSSWSCLAGGSGSPGGPTAAIQFNGSGTFAGSGNLTWNNTSQVLNAIATSASSPAINAQVGFIQAQTGFVSFGTTIQSLNSLLGGGNALAFSAVRYMNTGNSSGTPTLVTGDSFNAGATYWDNTAHCQKVFSDTSLWSCLLSGSSAGVTSLNTLTGALTITGTTNQINLSSLGTNITLATPQDIATSSTPTFGGLNVSGSILPTTVGTIAIGGKPNPFGGIFGLSNVSSTKFEIYESGSADLTGNFFNITSNVDVFQKSYNFNDDTNAPIVQFATILSGAANRLAIFDMSIAPKTSGAYDLGTGNAWRNLNWSGSLIQSSTTRVDSTGSAFFNAGTFSSALTANGGVVTPSTSNSSIFIGSFGNLYLRTFSGTPSCTGIADGWVGYDTTGNHIWVCAGGIAFAH